MPLYRLAEEDFFFPHPIAELEPFEASDGTIEKLFVSSAYLENQYSKLISRADGWVVGTNHIVEVYGSESGFLLKVEDCGEYFIAPRGEAIGKRNPKEELSQLDREILLGPVVVLALALRHVWSLHASAAMYKENVIVFLGESGMGKSTLAAYLSQSTGWRLVADDILPVKKDANMVTVLPHFPQLKLPTNAQPGVGLPERLPLTNICVLTHAGPDEMPELQKITTAQAVQALLGHIAGTRLFNAELLSRHLEFSTQAAKHVSAYRLIHPHRRDTLPLVREFLEKIC